MPTFKTSAEPAAVQSKIRSLSILETAEPPRGLDPSSHHRNVMANLLAARTALQNSGSVLPKIVADPQGSKNPPSAPFILGSARSATIVGSNPPVNRLARTDGPGNAENSGQTDLVSPAFLAAAAARFTEMSAEELCDTLTTIVPKFAACRRHWLKKSFTGINLVLCETPNTFMVQMGSWKGADGEFVFTDPQIESVTLILAQIIAGSNINPKLAESWTALLSCEQEEVPLPLFSSLTSEQTFEFVLELCPHLERLALLWNMHGLTGRELLAYSPHLLMGILTDFHEIIPNTQRVPPHQCQRIRESILIAMRRHKSDEEVNAVIEQHEQYHAQAMGSHGGGVKTPATDSRIATPSQKPNGIIAASAELAATLGKRSSTREHTVNPKNLTASFLTRTPGTGDISFMEQFGSLKRGTQLYSAPQEVSVVSGGQNQIIVNQSAVASAYKLFDEFTHSGWMSFIKQYREETVRLPRVSRRPLKELIKPSVIEQLQEEVGFDEFADVTDDDIVSYCFRRFGPRSAREAKNRLEADKFYFNDATMLQSTFTPRLVRFFSEKLTMLADFEHAARHWKDGEILSKFMQLDSLSKMFPTDEETVGLTAKPKSKSHRTTLSFVSSSESTPRATRSSTKWSK